MGVCSLWFWGFVGFYLLLIVDSWFGGENLQFFLQKFQPFERFGFKNLGKTSLNKDQKSKFFSLAFNKTLQTLICNKNSVQLDFSILSWSIDTMGVFKMFISLQKCRKNFREALLIESHLLCIQNPLQITSFLKNISNFL